jgi:hypothetical protein
VLAGLRAKAQLSSDMVPADRVAERLALEAIVGVRNQLQVHDSRQLLVLFDPAAGEVDTPLPEVLKGRVSRARINYQDLASAQQPWCVGIDDEEHCERFVNETIHDAIRQQQEDCPRTVCGWMIPSEALLGSQQRFESRFAAGLSATAVQVDEHGKRCLLRWFDPRVLELIRLWLRSDQTSALLGPVRAWMFIDGAGRLQVLTPEVRNDWAAPRIDAPQWAKLRRAGLINQLLPLASQWGVPAADKREIVTLLDHALARSEAQGLSSEADAMVFVSCALNVHSRFDEHPAFAALLSRAKGGGAPFSESAAALNESVLEEVAAGRWLDSQRRA